MSGIYTIMLNDEDLELLHEDYSCVEPVIDKIIEQAKHQGYKPPEEYNDV